MTDRRSKIDFLKIQYNNTIRGNPGTVPGLRYTIGPINNTFKSQK